MDPTSYENITFAEQEDPRQPPTRKRKRLRKFIACDRCAEVRRKCKLNPTRTNTCDTCVEVDKRSVYKPCKWTRRDEYQKEIAEKRSGKTLLRPGAREDVGGGGTGGQGRDLPSGGSQVRHDVTSSVRASASNARNGEDMNVLRPQADAWPASTPQAPASRIVRIVSERRRGVRAQPYHPGLHGAGPIPHIPAQSVRAIEHRPDLHGTETTPHIPAQGVPAIEHQPNLSGAGTTVPPIPSQTTQPFEGFEGSPFGPNIPSHLPPPHFDSRFPWQPHPTVLDICVNCLSEPGSEFGKLFYEFGWKERSEFGFLDPLLSNAIVAFGARYVQPHSIAVLAAPDDALYEAGSEYWENCKALFHQRQPIVNVYIADRLDYILALVLMGWTAYGRSSANLRECQFYGNLAIDELSKIDRKEMEGRIRQEYPSQDALQRLILGWYCVARLDGVMAWTISEAAMGEPKIEPKVQRLFAKDSFILQICQTEPSAAPTPRTLESLALSEISQALSEMNELRRNLVAGTELRQAQDRILHIRNELHPLIRPNKLNIRRFHRSNRGTVFVQFQLAIFSWAIMIVCPGFLHLQRTMPAGSYDLACELALEMIQFLQDVKNEVGDSDVVVAAAGPCISIIFRPAAKALEIRHRATKYSDMRVVQSIDKLLDILTPAASRWKNVRPIHQFLVNLRVYQMQRSPSAHVIHPTRMHLGGVDHPHSFAHPGDDVFVGYIPSSTGNGLYQTTYESAFTYQENVYAGAGNPVHAPEHIGPYGNLSSNGPLVPFMGEGVNEAGPSTLTFSHEPSQDSLPIPFYPGSQYTTLPRHDLPQLSTSGSHPFVELDLAQSQPQVFEPATPLYHPAPMHGLGQQSQQSQPLSPSAYSQASIGYDRRTTSTLSSGSERQDLLAIPPDGYHPKTREDLSHALEHPGLYMAASFPSGQGDMPFSPPNTEWSHLDEPPYGPTLPEHSQY